MLHRYHAFVVQIFVYFLSLEMAIQKAKKLLPIMMV